MISNELVEQLKKELSMVQTFPKEKKKVESHVGTDIMTLLSMNNAIIAGGMITSIFTNKEINDVDIYFRSKEDFSRFFVGLLTGEYGYHTIAHYTDRSILFTDHNAKCQAIVYKFFPTPEDIFNDFDFSVNMGAYDCKTGEFVLHDNFLKHNAQRYIEVNTGTAYPLISVLRVDKYRQKGYSISKPQMLKLLFAVSKIKIDNWDEVVDHVSGMYGVDPEKLFDRTKEFSIDEVILQIGNLESVDGEWNQVVDFKEMTNKLKDSFTDEAVVLINNNPLGDDEAMEFAFPDSKTVKLAVVGTPLDFF